MNPTFNHKILSSFVPIFNQKVEVLAMNLDGKINTSEMFDISPYLFACTLDMVCGKYILLNSFTDEKVVISGLKWKHF